MSSGSPIRERRKRRYRKCENFFVFTFFCISVFKEHKIIYRVRLYETFEFQVFQKFSSFGTRLIVYFQIKSFVLCSLPFDTFSLFSRPYSKVESSIPCDASESDFFEYNL